MPMRSIKYAFKQEETVHKLYIYDDVTAYGDFNWNSWSYEDSETSAKFFKEQLDKVKEGDSIELYINSYGGEVKEGVSIYNQLNRCNANITCYIDGYAYSVASLIAMAADKIIMGLGTSMLIHEMWTMTTGNAEQLRKTADDLETLMESNRKIYLKRAKGITEEELIDMMKKETILTPDQCLKYGFCDEIAEQVPVHQERNKQLAEQRMMQMQKEMQQQKHIRQEFLEFMKSAQDGTSQEHEQQEKKPGELLMSAMIRAFTKQNV